MTDKYKGIKDIRMINEKGLTYRVIYYHDGTIDMKLIAKEKVDNLVDAINKTPELKVIKGGKKEKGNTTLVFLLVLGLITLSLMGCRDKNDPDCTSRNWHKYDECY